MTFYLDLDGTILDVSEKFYQTYCDILVAEGYSSNLLSKTQYWELKKSKLSETEILKKTDVKFPEFSQKRKLIIETTKYQSFDFIIPGVLETIEKLSKSNTLILVTIRHNRDTLIHELENLGLLRYFEVILNDHQEIKEKWKLKSRLVMDYHKNLIPKHTVFVGDSNADILAGKLLGSTTVGVLSGMSDEKEINSLSPDYVIGNLNDIFGVPLQ